ncbi:MAG: sigma-70 family RNA polymerase sigma factor [Blastocatellia bacterium]|nr:sigma-70 family RNA polymerase sigma factor [Blastocatellia bacterium]
MKIAISTTSDVELLRLMLAGDAGAFEQIYQRWQSPIFRFAMRLSGSQTIAEDVTQEVFLALIRDGHQYGERGSFAAYIFTIARNRVWRRLRRERWFVKIEAVEPDDTTAMERQDRLIAQEDPLADLTREEIISAVRRAVIALPVHYREVVLLCYLHELSYADAAQVIGCEIGTVRSRLHRARALLAEKLDAMKTTAAPQKNVKLSRCLA